jgi:hypothetical protein
MSTGISFLDSIINGVNSAVNTVSNIVNNASSIANSMPYQAASQLGNILSGINNTVSNVVNNAVAQVTNSTPVQQTVYNNPPNSSYNPYTYTPQQPIGVQMGTPGSVTSSPYTTSYNPPQGTTYTTSNVTLNGFDFNTVYAAVNAAFQNLPTIIAAIQNPLNNPITNQLVTIVQDLASQQAANTAQVSTFIDKLGSAFYQSTSNILKDFGVDIGGWSNLLDAAVRDLMQTIGYSSQKSLDDVSAMVKAGYEKQADAIFQSQMNLNNFIQQVQAAFQDNQKTLDAIGKAVGSTTQYDTRDLVTQAVDAAGKELQQVLIDAFTDISKDPNNFFRVLSDRIENISLIIEQMKAGKFKTTDAFFNALFGNLPASGLARGLLILAETIPTLIQAVNMGSEPTIEAFQHLVQASSPVKLLSAADYLTAYYKQVITIDELQDYLTKLGISHQQSDILINASIEEPGFSMMIDARRRGFLDDTQWLNYMVEQRFSLDAAHLIDKLLVTLPGPQDLTRIADKRIWSGKLPEKYGQYAELPQEYTDYMAQWGFDSKFTEWFWAAHWELPSPNQIFEMYQRHVINQEDMQSYLALTPWLPFFRDKLLAISYNPLTRVDIRRMYGLGMFTYDELLLRYQAIGFSPDDSRLMADFTVKFSTDSEENELEKLKNKIVTAVEGLFVRGKIDREQAINRLVALGKDRQFAELTLNFLGYEQNIDTVKPKLEAYKTRAIKLVVSGYLKAHYAKEEAYSSLLQAGLTSEEATAELDYADLERLLQIKADQITIIETQFVNGIITEAEFISQLSRLSLSSAEVNQELGEAKLKIEKRFKMPTEVQVQKWFNDGKIDENYVIQYLKFIGYPDAIIPTVLLGDYGIGA